MEKNNYDDELLNQLALIMLTYTVLEGLMSIVSKDKKKEYNRLSKAIIKTIKSQGMTQDKVIKDILNSTVNKTFNHYSYNANLKDVRKIIEDNFKGKHFSDRVWENEKLAAERLHKQVNDFLNGKINVNQIKKDIEKTYNNGAYNTKRLVETEVARCSSNAFDRFCIETGVKKVRYNATLDSKLCDDCGKYHNKVFDFKDKIEVPRHPLCRCFYDIEDDDYKSKSKAEDEVAVTKFEGETLEDFRNKILNGEYNLNINKGSHNKHVRDSKGYLEGRSYLTISMEEAQNLVDKFAGTGELLTTKSGIWDDKELISSNDKLIGYDKKKKGGVETATNKFVIHYSDKGTHIVPSLRGE